MLRYTFGKYIYIAFTIALTIFYFCSFVQLSTPYFLALVLLWIFSFYTVISPIVKWNNFKQFLISEPEVYIPSSREGQLKRDFFNLRVHSDANAVDVFEENKLQVTFYITEGEVRTNRGNKQFINYSQSKALVSRISEIQSFSLLDYIDNSSMRVMRIYSARFYILTKSNRPKYLFTSYCRFDEYKARDVERTLHSKEDFSRLLESFSRELSDLTNLPMIVYKEKQTVF